MSPWEDKATASIKIATDILFVRNPLGTSMGVITGVIIHGVVDFFSPALDTIQGIKLSALSLWHYIAIGIFGFNVSTFRKRNKVSPEIEERIAFIAQMRKSGKITESQAKLHYLALIKKVVENVSLNSDTKKQVDAMQEAFSEKPNE